MVKKKEREAFWGDYFFNISRQKLKSNLVFEDVHVLESKVLPCLL